MKKDIKKMNETHFKASKCNNTQKVSSLFMLFFLSFNVLCIGQTYSVNSGNWENPSIWDCNCIPSPSHDIIIRHSVILGENAGNVTVSSIRVSNETGPTPFQDAELTVQGGISLTVTGAIEVVSANFSGGGDDVRFTLQGDGTTIICGAFHWQREDSRENTELLFRMYNNSHLTVLNNFVMETLDDTSEEFNVDFKMADDTNEIEDEAPLITIGGDFLIRIDKLNTISNLSILLREYSTIMVDNNMTLSMINSPDNSDIYLYLADLPSRINPGTDNISKTFSSLHVAGTLTLEIPAVSTLDDPDIRCDIRGNAQVVVNKFEMHFLNGNTISAGNGAQDIDMILFDNASLVIQTDLEMVSELDTETMNNLLDLRDNSSCLINGNIKMRADIDDLENKILVQNTAHLELKGNTDRADGSPGSNYTTEGMIEFLNNSTFTLSGSTPQVLPWAHNGHYRNLVINNTSGQNILLEGDIRMNGHLTMTRGIIVSEFSPNSLNDDNLFLFDFLPSSSSNLGNANSFFTGRIRVTDRNSSGNPLNLPLGIKEGSIKRWAPLIVNDFDIAVNPSFYIQYVLETPPNNTSLIIPLTHVSEFEYWEIGRNSGGNWASGEVFSTATFTIPWQNACSSGIGDSGTLYGAWLDNNNTITNVNDDLWRSGTTQEIQGNVCDFESPSLAQGSIRFSFTNSGTFRTRGITFGTSEIEENPLPVTLKEFKADLHTGNQIKLMWTTLSEQNSDYFTLSHSIDGKIFKEIGKIKAMGNSSETLHYEFIDIAPFNGLNYYQLTQTDFDETEHFQGIVAYRIKSKDEMHEIDIFPNPVGQSKIITVVKRKNSNESPIELRIIASNGKDVTYLCELIEQTDRKTILKVDKLPAGIYHCIYKSDGEKGVRNIVIK
jgi:hypothetical protein